MILTELPPRTVAVIDAVQDSGENDTIARRLRELGFVAGEAVSVVGPLCTPLDLLADRMALPEARPGDLIALYQSGAYGATASPRGFLSHPDLVEVLV